jgi:hypothetical protein
MKEIEARKKRSKTQFLEDQRGPEGELAQAEQMGERGKQIAILSRLKAVNGGDLPRPLDNKLSNLKKPKR